MYRDERAALRARIETLDAELRAERAARSAADAHARACEARAAEVIRAVGRGGGPDELIGWWGRPWVALSISLVLALGTYLALRASLHLHEPDRRAVAVTYAGCLRSHDLRAARRVVERHRVELESCYTREIPAGNAMSRWMDVRMTLEPSGEVSVTSVQSPEFHQGLASCVQGTLRRLPFPSLALPEPLTLQFVLAFPR